MQRMNGQAETPDRTADGITTGTLEVVDPALQDFTASLNEMLSTFVSIV